MSLGLWPPPMGGGLRLVSVAGACVHARICGWVVCGARLPAAAAATTIATTDHSAAPREHTHTHAP